MFNHFMGAVAMALLTQSGAAAAAGGEGDAQIVELRQYQLVDGTRDAFVTLFEDKLVDGQEAAGMRLVGQFRDRDDAQRFTWIRSFRDMAARERALNEFYFGPVWKAHRAAANPLLVDNDNVLLLRPAAPGLAFAPAAARDSAAAPGAVLAVIEYLWKAPGEGFATFFGERMKPALEAGGLTVVGAYVPLDEPNNFPQLPVRPDRKLLVWFVRGDSHNAIAEKLDHVRQSQQWKRDIAGSLHAAEERAPQTLHLDPAARSALR